MPQYPPMRLLFALFSMLIFGTINLSAQTCLHTNLSYKYDYKVSFRKTPHPNSTVMENAPVTITIYQKKTRAIVQTLKYKANFVFDGIFSHCDSVRSYITGYKQDTEVSDYDFGDLIIADLNFDGLEDIAIKHDSGGNGGPFYNFYIQDGSGHFQLDRYLTDSVGSFPRFINPKRKTIATQIHANVSQENRSIYRYNTKTRKWKFIGGKLITERAE